MGRKSGTLEARGITAVTELPGAEALNISPMDADLAVVRGELATALAAWRKRADLQYGDPDVQAVRIRASLNGPVRRSPELGDAIQGVLTNGWGHLDGMSEGAAADLVVARVRRQLLAAAEQKAAEPAVINYTTAKATVEAAPDVKAVVSDNPPMDKLMGYIEQLHAADDVKAALRRDIGGMKGAVKDPHTFRTAKKAILKAANKNAVANKDLIARLG